MDKKLRLIGEVAKQLASIDDLESRFQHIIDLMENLLGYEYGAVLILDDLTKTLQPYALSQQNRGPEFVEEDKTYISSQNIMAGRGITGWVAQHGESINCGDITQDSRYYGVRNDIRSELCVPIKMENQTIGVLNIETSIVNAYTEADQAVLETIANQISLALLNHNIQKQFSSYRQHLGVAVLQRLISSASHDINTPLTVIKTYLHLLKHSSLASKQLQQLEIIIEQTQRLETIFEEMFNVLRIDLTVHERQEVDLENVIAEIVQNCQPQIDAKNIIISFHCDSDIDLIEGDTANIYKAVQNLVHNAIQYNIGGGSINIDLFNEGAFICLEIRDTGIGMPQTIIDEIFDAFFRADVARTNYGGHVGLGLTFTKRVIEQHDGTIVVKSIEGEGSTFTVNLPNPKLTNR